MKFTSALKLKLIYVFRINDDEHKGCLKIGEATSQEEDIWGLEPNSKILNEAATKRINQYTQTAGVQYDLLYTEVSVYNSKDGLLAFSDAEVHSVLMRSGIKKKIFDKQNKANEWFITDLETVKNAIAAVKAGRSSLIAGQISQEMSPVVFRPEQKQAIEKTKKQFAKGDVMLWNAKMRFGKTLSALQVVRDMNFKRTLILTHRPVVDAGWFDDFKKIFYDRNDYIYGSKSKGESFQSLTDCSKREKCNFVYFASMQDLRGSQQVGGNFDKNNEVLDAAWDMIIIDEAHEGTQTELGANVLTALKKPNTKVLELSGTPFNLLDNHLEDEIFTWDYVMEQKAKNDWELIHFGDPNPYAGLPKLNIYTFDLGKLLKDFIDEEVAFNFREFFRTNKSGGFVHNADVKKFLDVICKEDMESYYPYSNAKFREYFRHSLWMVPGVREARALSALLQSHPVFAQFEIVNVAGDGDEEQANQEALGKVKKAIGKHPNETYSITLSCGRLTTGVSVPAWTAVFMLSGSYNTSASSYMQTIFRVQTPANINGRIKEECFVFDFAPDRTLKVLAQTAKISAKAGKTTDNDRETMHDFLNYCPIIAVDGSRMNQYDVESMLEQLKKIYIERVVRNGFEDGYLYNDGLMNLSAIELKEFDKLKAIIGSTKAMHKTADIDINDQGMKNEKHDANGNNGKTKDTSPEQEEVKKEKAEKRKIRDAAISILRGISIRMPLMIYGATAADEDKEITIDNFANLIDDSSWEEFMPKGVSKDVFEGFKKYYDPDIFRAAGKKIRAMARAADKLCIEERIDRISEIFNTFRNPDKETVLTPWRVVNMHMSDCLGGYTFYDDAFAKKIDSARLVRQGDATRQVFSSKSRVLEINSKSGLYPLYMAYSIFRTRSEDIYPFGFDPDDFIEQQQDVWDKVLADNIFIICKTPMAKSITKRTLAGFRHAKVNAIYAENLVESISTDPDGFAEKVLQGNSFWKLNNKNNNTMKFNAIVGNPPYQEMDGGAQASAKPVYHRFVEVAKILNPQFISMIMPSRWYAGGKGLDEFREIMLNDPNLSILHDFLNPELVFPNTNIRGGICYFLWDSNYNNKKHLTKVVTHQAGAEPVSNMRSLRSEHSDTFVRHDVAVSIIEKVSKSPNFMSFAKHVSSRKPFSLDGLFVNKKEYYSSATGLEEPIICYGKGQKIGYVEKAFIPSKCEWINRYKVFTPRANNIGTELNDDNLNTFVGEPGTICTESYIVLGADLKLDSISANNLKKYFNTKFARFQHSLAKAGHDATAKTYKFVPLQDFTSASDIDWSKSISEIDAQLYKKYKLTDEEIKFIESMIKPMD